MKCERAVLYLADYNENKLNFFAHFRITRHLLKCPECKRHLNLLQKTINVLEADVLPEPSYEIWEQIKNNVVHISNRIPRKYSFYPQRRRIALAVCLLLLIAVPSILLIIPSSNNKEHSLFWTFFNSDLWNFSNFFRKLDRKRFVQLTPKIEKRFKIRLTKELQLDKKDESRLFPLLSKFSNRMRQYCYRYTYVLSALTSAVEENKKNDLEKWLRELNAIRHKWTNTRWRLLKDVRFILKKEQFARFLIFTERLPQEIKSICLEIYDIKG